MKLKRALNHRWFNDQERAFLAAILEDPATDAHRLVYADWLDDNRRPEEAEFIRLQCRNARDGQAWWEYECSQRERALIRKHGYRWRGERTNRSGGLSSGLRDFGFHRGLPAVGSTCWNCDSGAVESTKRLTRVARHFQLSVCINVQGGALGGPGDPLLLLNHQIVQRAQHLTIFRLRAPHEYVPLPDSFVEAAILAIGDRRLVGVQFGPVTEEGRRMIDEHLTPRMNVRFRGES